MERARNVGVKISRPLGLVKEAPWPSEDALHEPITPKGWAATIWAEPWGMKLQTRYDFRVSEKVKKLFTSLPLYNRVPCQCPLYCVRGNKGLGLPCFPDHQRTQYWSFLSQPLPSEHSSTLITYTCSLLPPLLGFYHHLPPGMGQSWVLQGKCEGSRSWVWQGHTHSHWSMICHRNRGEKMKPP